MKKIWIVGSLGHMGQALIRLLDMMEYELYETDKDELDITDEHAVPCSCTGVVPMSSSTVQDIILPPVQRSRRRIWLTRSMP